MPGILCIRLCVIFGKLEPFRSPFTVQSHLSERNLSGTNEDYRIGTKVLILDVVLQLRTPNILIDLGAGRLDKTFNSVSLVFLVLVEL